MSVAEPVPPQPDVSVLLCVHNGERYVEAALESMSAQTLENIEIVVVDDCSTDSTPDILVRLAAADPRIRVVRPERNLRLAGALNFGLGHVRAPYVARMDDDDISLPRRLAVQKAYLDAHPEITLVGSSIEWIDETGRIQRRSIRSRDNIAVSWSVRFVPTIAHPTFMFRTVQSNGTALRYNPDCPLAQDYELICRLILSGDRVACLPDVLVKYRTHATATSRTKLKEQLAIARGVGETYQRHQLPADVFEALAPLRELYFDLAPATPERIAASFAGARKALAHDIAAHPDRAIWFRRQTAQFLAWCLRRGGASARVVAMSFLRHDPALLPTVALRALETKALLPRTLRSDPQVVAAP